MDSARRRGLCAGPCVAPGERGARPGKAIPMPGPPNTQSIYVKRFTFEFVLPIRALRSITSHSMIENRPSPALAVERALPEVSAVRVGARACGRGARVRCGPCSSGLPRKAPRARTPVSCCQGRGLDPFVAPGAVLVGKSVRQGQAWWAPCTAGPPRTSGWLDLFRCGEPGPRPDLQEQSPGFSSRVALAPAGAPESHLARPLTAGFAAVYTCASMFSAATQSQRLGLRLALLLRRAGEAI